MGEIKDILQNESRFVLSNLTFFATQNEKLLPNGIFEDCTAKTIKLINILRPKHILCLGGENCINPLMKEGNFKVKYLLPFGYLSYGKFNGIPVYGIRHTTYRYTKEEMNLVGKCLKYLLDNPNKDFSVEEKEIQEKFADDIKAVEERKAKNIKLNKNEWFNKLELLSKQLSEKSGLKREIVGDGLKFTYNDNFYIFFGEVDCKIYSSIKTKDAFSGKAVFVKKADIFNCDKYQKWNPYGLNVFNDWQYWTRNIDVLSEEKGLEKLLEEEIKNIKNWIDKNLNNK